MKKSRALVLLCQMIDCIDTLGCSDRLPRQTTYNIIKNNTDIEDYELRSLGIDMDYIKKEV